MNWKVGADFTYYDFWRSGINLIASENPTTESKIYLPSQKLSVVGKDLFDGPIPRNGPFPYITAAANEKSHKDVCVLFNMICILLNEVN